MSTIEYLHYLFILLFRVYDLTTMHRVNSREKKNNKYVFYFLFLNLQEIILVNIWVRYGNEYVKRKLINYSFYTSADTSSKEFFF